MNGKCRSRAVARLPRRSPASHAARDIHKRGCQTSSAQALLADVAATPASARSIGALAASAGGEAVTGATIKADGDASSAAAASPRAANPEIRTWLLPPLANASLP